MTPPDPSCAEYFSNSLMTDLGDDLGGAPKPPIGPCDRPRSIIGASFKFKLGNAMPGDKFSGEEVLRLPSG